MALIATGIAASVSCAHTAPAHLTNVAWGEAGLGAEQVGARPIRYEDTLGKPLVVTVLATWCFPCLVDVATINHLATKFGAEGLRQIVVLVDAEGGEVVEPFVQEYQLLAPVVVASNALRTGQTIFGRIPNLPARYIFDSSGQLVAAYSGVATPESVVSVVETLVRATR